MNPIRIFKNNVQQNAGVELTPFMFDDYSRNKPTRFELYFRPNGEYEYRAIAQVDSNGNITGVAVSENNGHGYIPANCKGGL